MIGDPNAKRIDN